MEDTSLDEFLESDGEAEPEEPSGSAVEPAVTTARWTVDGAVCAVCETAANRLWNDDGEFVCRDCKDW